MDEKQLGETLRAIAQEKVSDDMNRWPEIKARLEQVDAKGMYGTPRGVRRFGKLLLIAAVLLLVSAGAYAVYQSTQSGIEGAREAGLVTEINLEKLVDGVIVRLNWAYADENQIVVDFDTFVLDEDGERREASKNMTFPVRLYRRSGLYSREIPQRSARADSGPSATSELIFDLTRLPDVPKTLQLTLEVAYPEKPQPWNFFTNLFQGRGTTFSNLQSFSPSPRINPEVTAEPAPLAVPRGGVGPFRFDFSLPVLPGLKIEVNQTAEVKGIPITFNSVRVSPSLIEVDFCYPVPDLEFQQWSPKTEMVIDGLRVERLMGVGTGRNDMSCNTSRADVFTDELPEHLTFAVTAFEKISYGNDGFHDRLRDLLLEKGMELDVQRDGGYSYQLTPENVHIINEAMVELGYRIEGPWEFTVEIPAR